MLWILYLTTGPFSAASNPKKRRSSAKRQVEQSSTKAALGARSKKRAGPKRSSSLAATVRPKKRRTNGTSSIQMIQTQSAKAKGRNLQKWTRNKILDLVHSLEPDDVKSTSMGAGGEDVQLSPAARKKMPVSIECKARKNIAVYSYYSQAQENCPENIEPLVIIKADRKKPLALVDAEYFLKLLSEARNK
jgi:hypothetical protein